MKCFNRLVGKLLVLRSCASAQLEGLDFAIGQKIVHGISKFIESVRKLQRLSLAEFFQSNFVLEVERVRSFVRRVRPPCWYLATSF